MFHVKLVTAILFVFTASLLLFWVLADAKPQKLSPEAGMVVYRGPVIAIEWRPVTTLGDGSPIPAGSRIYYEVWTMKTNCKDRRLEGKTYVPWANVYLRNGRYYVGVRAIREIDGIPSSESDISWSNDPVVVDGSTFILQGAKK